MGLIQMAKHFVCGLFMLGRSGSMERSFLSLKRSHHCDAHVPGKASYKRLACIAGLLCRCLDITPFQAKVTLTRIVKRTSSKEVQPVVKLPFKSGV